MENVVAILAQNPLFEGLSEQEINMITGCLQAKRQKYKKGSTIFRMGDSLNEVGIVISGRVNTIYEDIFGGRNLMSTMAESELFADAFACSGNKTAPVDIVCAVDSEIVLIKVECILHMCANACDKHRRIMSNLVRILADKYMDLNRKMIHFSGRTIRRKVLSYLSYQAQKAGSDSFTIPFNQQDLADYLFVERSGLSVELNKLKKEGVIDFERNKFTINREAFIEE